AKAFLLKRQISDRKDFIHNKNFRIEMSRNGERQPDIHSAGVMLHRCIKELFDFGKSNDLIEAARDFRSAHAENRAIEKDILPSCEFGMKSGANLEQACESSANCDGSLSGTGDARKNLQ